MSLLVPKWTVLRSWGRKLNIKARPNPFPFFPFSRRNMSLKHGEFVGSLDCGTTYGFFALTYHPTIVLSDI